MTQGARQRHIAMMADTLDPIGIIARVTKSGSDRDYDGRLRLWAADYAAHVVHWLRDQEPEYTQACAAIASARSVARDIIDGTTLDAPASVTDASASQDPAILVHASAIFAANGNAACAARRHGTPDRQAAKRVNGLRAAGRFTLPWLPGGRRGG